MACDTRLRQGQSIQQRAADVRSAVEKLEKLLLRRAVRAVVGPQGAVTFTGWDAADRDGVTDACAYRRIMATGSAFTKLELQRAALAAGVAINPQAMAQGIHSHDGGASWHGKG